MNQQSEVIDNTLDGSSLHESETDTIQDIEQDYQQETNEIIEDEQQKNFVEEENVEEIEEGFEIPSMIENPIEINEKLIIPKLDLIDDVHGTLKEPGITNGHSESEIESLEEKKPEGKPEEEIFDEQNSDFNIDIDKTFSNSLNTE